MAFPLTKALRDHLSADAELVALLGTYGGEPAVVTHPIPGDLLQVDPPAAPWITLFRAQQDIDDGHKELDGRTVRRIIGAYDSLNIGHTGTVEKVEDIAERVRALLHRQVLELPGWAPWRMTCEGPRDGATSDDLVGLVIEVEVSAFVTPAP